MIVLLAVAVYFALVSMDVLGIIPIVIGVCAGILQYYGIGKRPKFSNSMEDAIRRGEITPNEAKMMMKKGAMTGYEDETQMTLMREKEREEVMKRGSEVFDKYLKW